MLLSENCDWCISKRLAEALFSTGLVALAETRESGKSKGDSKKSRWEEFGVVSCCCLVGCSSTLLSSIVKGVNKPKSKSKLLSVSKDAGNWVLSHDGMLTIWALLLLNSSLWRQWAADAVSEPSLLLQTATVSNVVAVAVDVVCLVLISFCSSRLKAFIWASLTSKATGWTKLSLLLLTASVSNVVAAAVDVVCLLLFCSSRLKACILVLWTSKPTDGCPS